MLRFRPPNEPMHDDKLRFHWLPLLVAVAMPPLLAYNLTPSATLFNQLASLAGWGLALGWLAVSGQGLARQMPAAGWALLLMLAAIAASPFWTGLPISLSLSGFAMVGAALLVLLAGAGSMGESRRRGFDALAAGLVVAGVVSAGICLIQVFQPDWADGAWIARSGIPGRAVGNMRQPNHLASLLLWAAIAAVYLAERHAVRRPALWTLLPLALFAFVFCVVLSASRTGMIGVGLLALWGLLDWADGKLSKTSRISLLATPVMLAISWWLMAAWAHGGGHAFGAESRLAEGAGSPSRLAILRDAWDLVKAYPLTGVGWGEFNLAWTMTPFPQRPIAFFDHTHNIVMQLLVELGVPLTLAVLGLLLWSMWKALAKGAGLVGEHGAMQRCAFMVVLMIGLHSLLEYPLWYAYFLLPTAYALGLCLAGDDKPVEAASSASGHMLLLGGVLLLLGSALALWDYRKIVVIYAPPEVAKPLQQRIEDGQASLFFAPQAEYAAATSLGVSPEALEAARRTGHNLIDVRLMMAWAQALHASGDDDRARYLVQRLKEFRNSQGDEWLAECEQVPSEAERPFQCDPPSRNYSFKEMR
ncbi:O-antigen ligase family protein [Pelomonas sp. SE-A7]|uniref:PglL family O-oligosaccharyltransferase n=1 Tax=Pelomonas sp. SE-A7 TaxID=3054953 RepID=UPI00259CCAA0|nr:O-antigen ligase family protein [Pelomonas sp. SE-A7]MDM4767053.1 Wzy polymerase domain-containing protein [Pelomonas sp. SE-A7]